MFKTDHPGVQRLALQFGKWSGRGIRPVHGVPQQGVPDVGHMDPDLVGAAGLQLALQMVKFAV